MSDVFWQAIIAGIVTIVIAWMQHRTRTAVERGTQVIDAVHTLVNSAMSTQLRISAVALRRVAELTHHHDDEAAAELAEQAYREQAAKQEIVDQGKSIQVEK